METQPPPPGESGSNPGRLVGATSNMQFLDTRQERRQKLVHRDAANVATKHMTQNAIEKSSATLKAVKIRSSMWF
jgi:hypothetical protein